MPITCGDDAKFDEIWKPPDGVSIERILYEYGE
jgi:hypothetical protein